VGIVGRAGSVRAANTTQGALKHRALLIIGTTAFATHNPASLDRRQPPEFNPLLYIPGLLLPIAGFGHKRCIKSTRLGALN
jgi:hypothetical protein